MRALVGLKGEQNTFTQIKISNGEFDLSSDAEDDEEEEDEEWFTSLCEIAQIGDSSTCQRFDTAGDCWGVMMFILAKDLGDLAGGVVDGIHAFRMLFASVFLFTNVLLQGTLLWWVYNVVATQSVQKIRAQYYAFHVECYDNSGMFNETGWSNFQHKERLCGSGMAQPMFLFCVLAIWTFAMLQEFRENFNIHRHIRSLPVLPEKVCPSHQVLEVDNTNQRAYLLVALTDRTRAAIYVLIIIPKYVIMFVLTFVGWRWLSASDSLENLILNSLALTFITTIDELVFNSVFPERLVDKVNEFKVCVAVEHFDCKVEREKREHELVTYYYCRSTCIVIIAATALCLYTIFFQDVIPGYIHHYKADLRAVCAKHAAEEHPMLCTGFLSREGCFPFGPQARLLSDGIHASAEM